MILGIIGPSYSVNKISECLMKIEKDIELRFYIREEVIDTLEVIEECEKECDAIMFTGIAVYDHIVNNYNVRKPHSYVSRMGNSIVRALWEMKNQNIDIKRLSIDIVKDNEMQEIISDFEIFPTGVYCLPFEECSSEEDCLNWHTKLYEEGKTENIITGYSYVYTELKKKGYPVFRLEPTQSLIRVCYYDIKSKRELSIAKESQIAVEIFSLDDNNEDIESYYSSKIRKSDVDKLIIDYVRNIQGSIFSFGKNEYIIFAHKGAVENEDNYIQIERVKKKVKSIGFSLSIGIGIGNNAYQAETNARKSLKKSIKSKDNDVFLINEVNSLKGPLGKENQLDYNIVSSDENIIAISEKIGLSCESIAKIMAITEKRKSNVYNAKELAGYLDISERSARRILNKVVLADMGRVCAKESSTSGGRPKNLIEILF